MVDKLTEEEARELRDRMTKRGPDVAAQFGVDPRTLCKAAAEQRIHPLTARVIRAALTKAT